MAATTSSHKLKRSKGAVIEEDRWCQLPDLVLERIFSYLSIEEKFYASLVCKSWNRGFFLPYSWSTFLFKDTTLTKSRFNYFSGWQYILDRARTQKCLSCIGTHIRALLISPMKNFYNVYEFMNTVSNNIEQHQSCKGIQRLKYTFPCNTTVGVEQEQQNRRPHGAGGKLLEALKRLMASLTDLKDLELVDLMLENTEALQLLDKVCCNQTKTLRRLKLINTTKTTCQLLHVGVFLNLQLLEISPQNLGEDVISLLGELRLQHLHILQNHYTPLDLNAVNSKVWRQCSVRNHQLKVHLRVESRRDRQLLWQESAPVHTVLYASPQCKLLPDVITKTIDFYSDQLRVFGHINIPRFYQPKSFNNRLDTSLLTMCRACTKLHTLVIRERISTCTVLLLAHQGKSLRHLYIRRNAVIIRCDWPYNPEWSTQFYERLRVASRSYSETEQEVSKKFGRSWHMLSDKEFKKLTTYQLTTDLM